MKFLRLWLLSAALLWGLLGGIAIAPANANTNDSKFDPQTLTANMIVSMAYRGCYTEQGIPGYTRFVQRISVRRITAKDLIEASGAPYSRELERAINSELRLLEFDVFSR